MNNPSAGRSGFAAQSTDPEIKRVLCCFAQDRQDNKYQKAQTVRPERIVAAACADSTGRYRSLCENSGW
jgi:hypothetical protein